MSVSMCNEILRYIYILVEWEKHNLINLVVKDSPTVYVNVNFTMKDNLDFIFRK